MIEHPQQFEAALARIGLFIVLGFTLIGGLSATAAYVWHLYRLASWGAGV